MEERAIDIYFMFCLSIRLISNSQTRCYKYHGVLLILIRHDLVAEKTLPTKGYRKNSKDKRLDKKCSSLNTQDVWRVNYQRSQCLAFTTIIYQKEYILLAEQLFPKNICVYLNFTNVSIHFYQFLFLSFFFFISSRQKCSTPIC